MSYYTNVNPDLLAAVSTSARHVLEVGCGGGAFARAYRERKPGARYVGIELFEEAAREAQGVVQSLITGDIEQASVLAELDRVMEGEKFDALIFGDVLEHLRDPWAVLTQLRQRMAPGAICSACIPNVSHWSVLKQLVSGRWDYADSGLLDRTHLRFFTLDTAIDLFRKSGWVAQDAKPRVLWREQTEANLQAFAPLAQSLGITTEKMRRDLSAFQWIIRASNPAA